MNRRLATGALLAVGLILAPLAGALAAGTRVLSETGSDFVEGELDGLVLDATGQLVPAPVQVTPWRTDDFFVWSLARDARGRLLAGTGDSGAIYREGKEGLETWTETLSLEILSLLPWEDGVLAGSSPDGIVFRIDGDGGSTVALDIPQQSIWDLEMGSSPGSWLAAAGPVARVVRVSAKTPAGEELMQLPAANATHLVRTDGVLWIGTQGPALVYRVDGDDEKPPRLVFEAPEDEVRALVGDGEGGVYVLSLDPTGAPGENGAPSSRITWLPAGGGSEILYAGTERFLAMARFPDGGLLLGEGETGRLIRLERQGQQSVWAELDGGDPIALQVEEDGTCFVGTGNLGVVYRLGAGDASDATYTSQVLEAAHVERWGRLIVDGRTEDVRFSTRTGVRRRPDDTWSEWSDRRSPGEGIESPPSPYVQYRLHLPGGKRGRSAVTGVRLAYAERNLPPVLSTVRVEPAGGALSTGGMNGSPPPVSQRFEDGLGVEYTIYQEREEAAPERTAWARGIRTVRWSAEDPNGDRLRYHAEVRQLPDGSWLRIGTDLESQVYAWDTRSFEDGLYQVRILAHDGPSNPRSLRREVTDVSAPVHVDNSAPDIKRLEWADREGNEIVAEVEDRSSALSEVSVRAEDGPWRPLEPEDGVLDGPRERFRFPAPDPPRAAPTPRIWMRAMDAAGNVSLRELPAP